MAESCLQACAVNPGPVPARLDSALRGKSRVRCRVVADVLDRRHGARAEISRLDCFGRNPLGRRALDLLRLHTAIGLVPKRAGRQLTDLAARELATQLDRAGLSGSLGRSPHASDRLALWSLVLGIKVRLGLLE
eukprot:scaffold27703_cov75-Phaeocystis_antarctica.AAC.12